MPIKEVAMKDGAAPIPLQFTIALPLFQGVT
jgi:hypothetical protein